MIDKTKLQICCICNKTIEPKYLGKDRENNHDYWYDGNNAQPVADGVWCDHCNKTVVIPERMTNIVMSRNLDSFNKLI